MSTVPDASPVDVRRLLARFILLVVLPAVGLVGFGVVAITNERAVVERRFADEYGARLRALAEKLASRMDDTASALAPGAPKSRGPLVRFGFVRDADGLRTTASAGPEVTDALTRALGGEQRALDEGTISIVSLARGPARGLYAVRSDAGVVTGVAFSEEALARLVEEEGRRLFPADAALFTLQGPRTSEPPPPSSNPMRRLVEELTAERGDSGTLSLPLPPPLADWRIVATLAGDDPVRTALWRNRTVYIVVLTIFYVVITVGVIVTLRGIAAEARLSRMKTDFVSNISHELRTPLTSIRMFAETLRLGRARTDEERAACLDVIVRESERLSVITERALEWGRLEAGRRRLVRETVAPRDLLLPVVDSLVSRGVLQRDILTIEEEANAPAVDVDPSALGQVLMNLLENAVKYSGPDRRVNIRLHATRRRVWFDVTDNGVGIARRDQKRIFERFYRADDLLARTTEGSGLGLSIARRIVVAHGGRLTVKSRVGRGSTFTVELPASRGEQRKEEAA